MLLPGVAEGRPTKCEAHGHRGMEGLDEGLGPGGSQHVDKEGVVCCVKTAQTEAGHEEGGHQEPEGRKPRHKEDEEAGGHEAGRQEGQLLPRPPHIQPEDQAGHDCCDASSKGAAGPYEVDLLVWHTNLVECIFFQSLFKLTSFRPPPLSHTGTTFDLAVITVCKSLLPGNTQILHFT